jgi:hypothetical protein
MDMVADDLAPWVVIKLPAMALMMVAALPSTMPFVLMPMMTPVWHHLSFIATDQFEGTT